MPQTPSPPTNPRKYYKESVQTSLLSIQIDKYERCIPINLLVREGQLIYKSVLGGGSKCVFVSKRERERENAEGNGFVPV